ncbi:hypothetical protein AAE478_010018 [Parahypoxylon ruwenzoriense]
MAVSALSILLGAIFFSRYAHAQNTQSVTAAWQLGSVPASLDASVVESRTGAGGSTVTYQVDCPASRSPENDACRSLSIYPAQMYHSQGSVYGGIVTERARSQTGTWRCELRDCNTCPGSRAETADCSIVMRRSGLPDTTSSTKVNSCYVKQHSVPLAITAGVEKLTADGFQATLAVPDYLTAWAGDLSTLGCPQRSALRADSASRTSTTTRTSSISTTIRTSTPTRDSGTTNGNSSPARKTKGPKRSSAGSWASTRLGLAPMVAGCGLVALYLTLGSAIL